MYLKSRYVTSITAISSHRIRVRFLISLYSLNTLVWIINVESMFIVIIIKRHRT